MKRFEPFAFDPERCCKEVGELMQWPQDHRHLREREDIRPFFRKRRHLSAFIASYSPNIIRFDRLAFQFSLFGDFSCDLAVGDSAQKSYCFIEFENAGPTSLFVKYGKRAARAWSPRFNHGFSQIIDWFYKLRDMEKTDEFVAQFGSRSINYTGILVIGRDQHFFPGERERLEWRTDKVVVASQKIQCVTFDRLLEEFSTRLERFSLAKQAGA
jgi:hypothetical protein